MKPVILLTILTAVAITTAVLTLSQGVFANDSIVRLGAGGIEFLTSEDIRILEEVLEISPNQVRVKYRFFNESDRDIH